MIIIIIFTALINNVLIQMVLERKEKLQCIKHTYFCAVVSMTGVVNQRLLTGFNGSRGTGRKVVVIWTFSAIHRSRGGQDDDFSILVLKCK